MTRVLPARICRPASPREGVKPPFVRNELRTPPQNDRSGAAKSGPVASFGRACAWRGCLDRSRTRDHGAGRQFHGGRCLYVAAGAAANRGHTGSVLLLLLLTGTLGVGAMLAAQTVHG